MKIIFTITMLIIIGFSVISCNDDLNTKPYDSFDKNEVFSSKENAEMFVNGLYYILKDKLSPDDEAECICEVPGGGSGYSRDQGTEDREGEIRRCNCNLYGRSTDA